MGESRWKKWGRCLVGVLIGVAANQVKIGVFGVIFCLLGALALQLLIEKPQWFRWLQPAFLPIRAAFCPLVEWIQWRHRSWRNRWIRRIFLGPNMTAESALAYLRFHPRNRSLDEAVVERMIKRAISRGHIRFWIPTGESTSGKSPRTIFRQADRKEIEGVRLGGELMFCEQEIRDKWPAPDWYKPESRNEAS